jgi:hypothetical protein
MSGTLKRRNEFWEITAMSVAFAEVQTFADLLEELGGISPSRVRFRPAPGHATEKDVVRIEASENRLFELVDGVLVEKAMGATQALLAGYIVHFFWEYLRSHDLGVALGADGMIRLRTRLVRIPDVSFISRDQIPGADVYTSPTDCRHLRPTQTLDGGDVLPGFKLSLKELFASTRRRSR